MIIERSTSLDEYLNANGITLEDLAEKEESRKTAEIERIKDRKLKNYIYNIKYRNRYYHTSTKHSARRRKIDFKLSKQYMFDLLNKQNNKCALSGIPITRDDSSASLDRIDSSKGYIEGNVQWVHKDVNFMKHTMNNDSFLTMCKIIADYNSLTVDRLGNKQER